MAYSITDNRTMTRQYPLPNAQNQIADDVLRMATAFTQIDSDIGIVPQYTVTPAVPPGGQFRLYTLKGEGVLRCIDSNGAIHILLLG